MLVLVSVCRGLRGVGWKSITRAKRFHSNEWSCPLEKGGVRGSRHKLFFLRAGSIGSREGVSKRAIDHM